MQKLMFALFTKHHWEFWFSLLSITAFFHSHAPAKAGKQPWPPCLQTHTKAHLMALKNVYQKWRCDRQDLEARCLEHHKPAWIWLKPQHYLKHSSSQITYHAKRVTEPYWLLLSTYWVCMPLTSSHIISSWWIGWVGLRHVGFDYKN